MTDKPNKILNEGKIPPTPPKPTVVRIEKGKIPPTPPKPQTTTDNK